MSGNRSLDEFADDGQEGGAEGRRAGDAPATEEGAAAEEATTTETADEATAAVEAAGEVASEGADDGPGGPTDEGGPDDATSEAIPDDSEPGAEVEADDDREAPDPPASTYVWRPEGGACADCGETVEERWRDDDDLVCAGCKDW